jgi:His/Glu/Gln/Arg/opine family amino acid ABC transporter permease subunit
MQIVRLLWDYREPLLAGIWMTIVLSVVAMLISLVVGLLACAGIMSHHRAIRAPSRLYVEFGRNTPIIVQLIWVHYALPDIIGLKFTPFVSSLVALTLQTSGYLAEEYRGGIEGIEAGQTEAARSLGLTHLQVMRLVVLPQAIVRILPGLLNQFVTCFKSTSIVSVIAVPDLMYEAGLIVSETFVAMPVYTFTAIVYFLLVLGVSAGVGAVARRLPGSAAHRERLIASQGKLLRWRDTRSGSAVTPR